jgi:hypothetical protein
MPDLIREVLDALDRMEKEPSDFEANVIETVTRKMQKGGLPSPKQCRILGEMLERYLPHSSLLRDFQKGDTDGPVSQATHRD